MLWTNSRHDRSNCVRNFQIEFLPQDCMSWWFNSYSIRFMIKRLLVWFLTTCRATESLSSHLVLHLAPVVSVLQLLKFGTLSLRLFECVPAMTLSAINSRPTTSNRPSNPLSASCLEPQIRLWLTIVRVYELYLLTYLLTYSSFLRWSSQPVTWHVIAKLIQKNNQVHLTENYR